MKKSNRIVRIFMTLTVALLVFSCSQTVGGLDDSELVTLESSKAIIGSDLIGCVISFQGANDLYVVAEKDDTGVPLQADRSKVGAWEQYTVVDAGDGFIAFIAGVNSNYLCADKSYTGVPVMANRTAIGDWEKFTWEDLGDNQVAIQANVNSLYWEISGDDSDDNAVTAAASSITSNATFTYDVISGTIVTSEDENPEVTDTSFTDTFDYDDSESYTDYYTVDEGTWEVTSDSVLHETSGGVGILVQSTISTSSDVTITADIMSQESTKDAGILARYTDSSNYYTMALDDDQLKLKKKVSGSWTTLASEDCSYTTTAYSEISLNITGTTLTGYFEGSQLFSVSDSSLSSGQFGIKTSSNAAYFDNLSIDYSGDDTVIEDEDEDDTTAPSSVTSLSATAGDSQVALSWSNPSDSDFSYVEISYGSTSTTSTGTSKTITGLTNDTSYTFSVVAYDESGNASSATTTSATPVADEDEDEDDDEDDITGEVVSVSSLSGLADAIESASAGQTIVLADGTYSGEIEGISSLTGTSSNPIIIRAESIGGVSIDLSSTIAITTSSYVTIKGFNFTSDEYSMMKIINCDNVSIMDNIFDEEWATDNKKTVVVNASAGISTDIEFGYNVFKNKDGQGGFITTEYDETYGISTTHHLHHNYFLNMMSEINSETGDFEGDSDREAVCFGVSDSYNIVTNHLVEYNLFEDCDGENEIITVKTDTNVLRYNTFKNCLGSLSLRFGDNHEVYGNIFYGDDTENNEETGGIRLYGSNQKIYNNYFYNLTGETSTHRMPIVIDAGGSGDHSKVEDSFIAFNTIVDCYYGIGVGMNYTSAPINNYIGNNIVVNSTMNNITVEYGSTTNVWEGNISYNETYTDDSSYVYSFDNPNMALSDGIYKLTSSSTNAIDSAIDSAGTYSDVTTDIDGGTRGSSKDIGADEYGVTGSLSLLTSSDVGQR